MAFSALEMHRSTDEIGSGSGRAMKLMGQGLWIEKEARLLGGDTPRHPRTMVVGHNHLPTPQHMKKASARLRIKGAHATQLAAVKQPGRNLKAIEHRRQAIERWRCLGN